MATYYDGLNYAFKLFEDDPPASSAQLIFLHLLHENNRHGNTGTVKISDRELGHRTRLSKQTITEAKRTLKNRGLIDFHTDRDKPKAPTVYTLPLFTLGQIVGQDIGQEVGQTLGQKVGHEGFVSYTAHAKDLRLKTEEINNNNTCTRELKETNALNEVGEHASDLDAIIDEWQESPCFAKLDFQLISELDVLLKKLGVSAIREAMDKAKRSNSNRNGVSFSYFKAILENTKGDKPSAKRGRKSVRTVQGEYDKSNTRQYPWDDNGREGKA